MTHHEIVLKSGERIEVQTDNMTIYTSRLNGRLESCRWTTREGATRTVHYLDAAEVAAIEAVED